MFPSLTSPLESMGCGEGFSKVLTSIGKGGRDASFLGCGLAVVVRVGSDTLTCCTSFKGALVSIIFRGFGSLTTLTLLSLCLLAGGGISSFFLLVLLTLYAKSAHENGFFFSLDMLSLNFESIYFTSSSNGSKYVSLSRTSFYRCNMT